MKKIILITVLTWLALAACGQTDIFDLPDSNTVVPAKSVIDVLQNKKQKLLKKIFANQDTLRNLVKAKPKEIVIDKKKIPVKAIIPLYVPDSIPHDDEEEGPLLPSAPIMLIVVPEAKLEKKTFFQKVFGIKRHTRYVIIINNSVT